MPWVQDEYGRNPTGETEYFFDCGKCMREQSTQTRQAMGCGYLAASPDAFPWSPSGRTLSPDEIDMDKPSRLALPVCPGYVCGLPEVIEASQAHFFLKNGGLVQFCDGEQPTPMLRDAVLQLECAYDAVIQHRSRESQRSKKP